jgi:hypothetical protein
MVEYDGELVLPFPRERIWKLLVDHLDDTLVTRIHPLIKRQRTISKDGDLTVLERTIDARGKLLTSEWRVTARPPDLYRWEILTSQGPYSPGSWLENTYVTEAGGTRVRTRGSLRISVLPFFLPQRSFINRVFDAIDTEDENYLRSPS